MNLFVVLIGGLAAGAASWLATAGVLRLLRQRGVLDIPNERSSHAAPTPRGGGIAVIGVLLAAWLAFWLSGAAIAATHEFWIILAAGAALALISWFDDVRGGLPAIVRLGAQAIAVGAGLFALPEGGVFQGALPPVLDLALSGLIWLWFVNLFNFMDGIDGIAGSQATSAGLGLFALAVIFPAAAWLGAYALALAAVALGFLAWNWQPARIFLGDVGSVPLGYAIGWLLLSLASFGLWQAALLLVLYFVADASFTLVRRLARGEPIWRAHKQHYYQFAVAAGRSHGHVVVAVTAVNLLLTGLALATTLSSAAAWSALGAGLLLTAALLCYLRFAIIRPAHAD
ncbi:MAG: putative undecaprenyl-phosphate N-acetylglucosaminyl 1-phosphate transferase [Alphaproteobacteria bacterium MarineAlpha10_Bin2]|nr:MAG: putative undecaprenyl-phosphate N-acetylglucosaminyl 1-phosphate transferase [Alphaproteobacteria bacterium MarineAlpha10_Bin2]